MRSLKRLFAIFRLFIGEIILSLFLGIAAVTAGIGLLGTSAFIIASAALHPSIAVLQVAIVGVRFFGISRGVFRYLERLVSHSVNLRVVSRLRKEFMLRIEPGAPANLVSRRGGDVLQSVMGDLQVLENFYVRVISPVIVAIVIVTGTSLFIGRYAVELGLILFSGMALTGFLQPILALRITRNPSRRLVMANAEASAKMLEVLGGLEDIQATNSENSFFDPLSREFAEAGGQQTHLAFLGGLNNGISLFLTNLIVIALLWVAIPMVNTGELSGISLAVIIMMSLAAFEAILPIYTAAQTYNASRVAAQRFFSIGEEGLLPPVPLDPLEALRDPIIQFEQVSFTFPGDDHPVLRNIDIEMKPGKRIAIVGASGTGKTSILNLLLAFHQPSHGRVSIGGADYQELESDFIRANFSVLSQDFHIFNEDVRQNLLLANSTAEDKDLLEAIRFSGLSDWLNSQEDGLDTWIGERGAKMSGGERQRLALARIFLQDRPYVVLDEPTSSLDRVTAMEVMENVLSWSAGKGVLLITHDLTWLPKMDEILMMEDGRIIEKGDLETLINIGDRFAELYAAEKDLLFES